MAEGGGISFSHSRSSDFIFDKNCTVCERKQKIREAINYCTSCCEYFCAGCLDFHNSLPVLSDHVAKLLGKSAISKSLPSVDSLDCSSLTTMCEVHGDKIIMICGHHDDLCCTICLATDHRTCEDVNYIPKIAHGFAKDHYMSKIKLDMETTKKEISTAKASRQSDQSRIDTERNLVLAQIKESRRRVNTVYDKLEQVTIGGMDKRYQEYGMNIQKDLKDCDEAIDDLEKSMHELEVTDKSNEPQLYVNVKRGSNCVQRWQHLRAIQNKYGKEKIRFIPDDAVEQYIAKMGKLGTFTDELTRIPSKRWPGWKELGVRIKEDMKPGCRIRGMCSLPNEGMLITDTRNNKLKRLNASFKVTDFYSVSKPRGVCFIELTQEAAVAEGETNIIHIVTMGKPMSLARRINTNHSCFGLAFSKGLLFVGECTSNKIHIYDYASGQHSATIEKDRTGQNLFSRHFICDIAVSACGNKIYVADFKRGLIIVDRERNLSVTVTDDELAGATGVCLDKDDNVYVCGRHSQTVLKFNFTHRQVRTLIQREYINGNPWSVGLDHSQTQLIVAMENDDTISVFDLAANK